MSGESCLLEIAGHLNESQIALEPVPNRGGYTGIDFAWISQGNIENQLNTTPGKQVRRGREFVK